MVDRDQDPIIYQNRSASGGVNSRVFPLDIADDQAVSLQNIDTSTTGLRNIRSGWNIAATGITFGPVLALKAFRKRQSDSPVLLAVAAGGSLSDHKKLYEWDGTGTTFDFIGTLTGYTASPYSDEGRVEIITGFDLNATEPYVAVIANAQTDVANKYYNGDIGGTPIADTAFGADVSGPTTVPHAYAYNRGFGRGDGDRKNYLYFSDVASWTATGWNGIVQAFAFGSDSQQNIVAIKDFRQQELIVYMSDRLEELVVSENTQAVLSGTAPTSPLLNYSKQIIDANIGCGAKDTVVKVGRDNLFMDQYGNIRSVARTIQDTAQGVESLPFSEPIHAFVQRINKAARKNSVAIAHDRWYVLGLPLDTATRPSHVFVMDVARSAQRGTIIWDGPWTDLSPFCMGTAVLDGATDAEDQNPTLYFGQNATADGGIVMRMFRGTQDNGSDIVYQETTKRIDFGDFSRFKSGETLDVFAVGTGNVTMTIEASLDAKRFQELGHMSLVGDAPALPQELPVVLGGEGVTVGRKDLSELEKFRDIQLRFTATAAEDVKFLGFTARSLIDDYVPEID